MKPEPNNLYKDIIYFGSGNVPDVASPKASFGGTWSAPNYALSYLLAARYTIERSVQDGRPDDVGLPVAYLQRHAFELALKGLLAMARDVKADADWLEALKKNSDADRKAPREVVFTHSLLELVTDLESAVLTVGFGPLPPEFGWMAERLNADERGRPDRLRYASVRDGKGRQAKTVHSFPETVELEIGVTQEQLEQLFSDHCILGDWFKMAHLDDSLFRNLAVESESIEQAVMRIVPVSEQFRRGADRMEVEAEALQPGPEREELLATAKHDRVEADRMDGIAGET